MMDKMTIVPGQLTLDDLRKIYYRPHLCVLDVRYRQLIKRSEAVVSDVVREGQVVYGINTGFGKFESQIISREQLTVLQQRLMLSHAAGTGDYLPDDVVRLILLLKVSSLAQGFSGVSCALVDALLALLNAGVYPRIPAQGSVGASGDLAPLAHIGVVLLGESSVSVGGQVLAASQGLSRAGLKPIKFAPKEGLALINGTQVSTALALVALFKVENLLTSALVTGGLSVDAALGSDGPFDRRIHEVRRHPGQIWVAKQLRELLEGSEIRMSHRSDKGCTKVQDPYSLRCQPQVMGACLDQLCHLGNVLGCEANAVTDNPLIFSDEGAVLSGGNFHAQPVALAADNMALVIATIGNLSERRIALLLDSGLSGLPAFLVKDGGVNSGFMVAHVTAAALTSENRFLSHPVCVDNIPTSANQEDHVSMATHAARRLLAMVDNAVGIVGIELLAAVQGVEWRKPLRTSKKLQQVLQLVREKIPFYEEDRFFAPDIHQARVLISSGAVAQVLGNEVLSEFI